VSGREQGSVHGGHPAGFAIGRGVDRAFVHRLDRYGNPAAGVAAWTTVCGRQAWPTDSVRPGWIYCPDECWYPLGHPSDSRATFERSGPLAVTRTEPPVCLIRSSPPAR